MEVETDMDHRANHTLIALDDEVYTPLNHNQPIVALDAKTGAVKRTYPVADRSVRIRKIKR